MAIYDQYEDQFAPNPYEQQAGAITSPQRPQVQSGPVITPMVQPQTQAQNPNPYSSVLDSVPQPQLEPNTTNAGPPVQPQTSPLTIQPQNEEIIPPGGDKPPEGEETTTTPPPPPPPPTPTGDQRTPEQRAADWAKAPGYEWIASLPDKGLSLVQSHWDWVQQDPANRSKVGADDYLLAYHFDKFPPGTDPYQSYAARARIYQQHKGYEEVSPHDVADYLEYASRKGNEGMLFTDWYYHRTLGKKGRPPGELGGYDTFLYSDANKTPRGFGPNTGQYTHPSGGGNPQPPAGGNPQTPTIYDGPGYAPGPQTGPTGNTPGGSGDPGQSEFDKIRAAIKQKGMGDIMEGERRLRSQLAALNPFADATGASGAIGQKYMSDSVTNLSAGLAQMDYDSFHKNQDRSLQRYLGDLDAGTRRYMADAGLEGARLSATAQMAAASAAAGAQMYDADLRYKLGLAGYDVQREGNWYAYNAAIFGTMPDFLRALYLYSPNAQLGNLPIFGPDFFVR
jgi:hypothetical protein